VHRSFTRLLLFAIGLAVLPGLSGCAWPWHHHRKPTSYDRSIYDQDKDPTWQPNEQRADEEVIER